MSISDPRYITENKNHSQIYSDKFFMFGALKAFTLQILLASAVSAETCNEHAGEIGALSKCQVMVLGFSWDYGKGYLKQTSKVDW